jgi:hypothetical protein
MVAVNECEEAGRICSLKITQIPKLTDFDGKLNKK